MHATESDHAFDFDVLVSSINQYQIIFNAQILKIKNKKLPVAVVRAVWRWRWRWLVAGGGLFSPLLSALLTFSLSLQNLASSSFFPKNACMSALFLDRIK